jgi:PPOX class probable FMN-dependent enzyme
MLPTTLSQPVTSPELLREIIGEPDAPAVKKQIGFLDAHCRRFIALSPLLFIASANAEGLCDVSPKGDAPGFVQVLSDHLLAIPERAGNRRTDTMRNILANPYLGLIFLIPGMRETLRINGRAGIYRDPDLLQAMTFQGKTPLVAIGVEVQEVFLHCGRALVRAQVWQPDTWPPADQRPSAGQIFLDHIQLPDTTCEQVEQILEESYTKRLY